MKDYEAFIEHITDHWKEQGFIEADTAPSGQVSEGQGHWHSMDGVPITGLPSTPIPGVTGLPRKAISKTDELITKGLSGDLSKEDQAAIAYELQIFRNMALNLEKTIHRWTKLFEQAGIE
jgi:hypothetical protein